MPPYTTIASKECGKVWTRCPCVVIVEPLNDKSGNEIEILYIIGLKHWNNRKLC